MNNKKIVNGLGHNDLVDYVLENSTLKKGQFALISSIFGKEDGYHHFFLTTDTLLEMGWVESNRFIEGDPCEENLFAMTKFLDLCIKKIEDPSIMVPILGGNPEGWDACYKK